MTGPDQRITRSDGTMSARDYWRPAPEGVLELGTVREPWVFRHTSTAKTR
jgi:hypothetical protein